MPPLASAGAVAWSAPTPSAPPRDAGLVEWRSCPLCGSGAGQAFLELADFQFYCDEPGECRRIDVRQVRCRDCGALHMNPAYTERGLERLFADAGRSFGVSAARVAERARWALAAARPAPGSAVVDLGCHDGRLLECLPPSLRRVGIERDAAVVAEARRERPGIELVVGDVARPAESLAGLRPELLTCFHVLEHLRDPLGALRALREWVGEGARMVLEAPVLECARPGDLVGFFTVHHLVHFTRASLGRMLAAAGWRVEASEDGPLGQRVLARAADPEPAAAAGAAPEDPTALEQYLAGQRASVERIERALGSFALRGRVAVWGAGNHTEYLFQRTSLFRPAERRFALVDADPRKWGRSWRGLPILPPERLEGLDWSDERLVLSSFGSRASMADEARVLGVPWDRTLDLYGSAA